MALAWNEIRSRALEFSKRWENETSEDAEAKPFWIEFLNIFGIDRKRVASFEEPVKKLGDKQGYIDLFWKGMLLVEHKSRGKDLDKAYTQALDYFPGIKERDLPKYVLVSDFARFRLYDLDPHSPAGGITSDLAASPAIARKPSRRRTRSTSRPPSAWAGCTMRSRRRVMQATRSKCCWCACCSACSPRTPASSSPPARSVPGSRNAPHPTAPTSGRNLRNCSRYSIRRKIIARRRWTNRSPTSTSPCAKRCSTAARWTGARSRPQYLARCSRASWTPRRGATSARTTPAKR